MEIEVKIRQITVRPDELVIDAKVLEEKAGGTSEYKGVYILKFSNRLDWNPYEAVHEIASHMAIFTGSSGKISGRSLRDDCLKLTEEDFVKRIYNLWNYCKYDYRLGAKGIFQIKRFEDGKFIEERDSRFRVAFGSALFQKDGGKRSKNSRYWLGDYKKTKIKFMPEYGYDLSRINGKLSPDIKVNIGTVLGKIGAESGNENYLLKSIEYYKSEATLNFKNPRTYLNWSGSLLALSKINNSRSILMDSFRKSALAFKYINENQLSIEDILVLYRNRGVALENLAFIDKNHHLLRHACKWYFKALDIKKDDFETYGCIGSCLYSFAESEDDIELFRQAAENSQLAIKLGGIRLEYYMVLGNSYWKLGVKCGTSANLIQALDTYNTALKQYPYNLNLNYNLSLVLLDYHALIKDDDLLIKIINSFFKTFLLSVLQKDLDLALYLAKTFLFEFLESYENSEYLILTNTYFQAIKVIHDRDLLDNDMIGLLKNNRGKFNDADLVIESILENSINKTLCDRNSSNLITKAAYFLAERVVSEN